MLATQTLGVAPGANGSTTLTVTSASNAAANTCTDAASAGSAAGAVHARTVSATCNVAAPAIVLQTTLTTHQPVYLRRATVLIAAQLRNNGTPLPGVVVTFTLVRPGNATATLTATTGSDGVARATYKVPNTKGALGSYTVTARGSFGGVTATPTSAGFAMQ